MTHTHSIVLNHDDSSPEMLFSVAGTYARGLQLPVSAVTSAGSSAVLLMTARVVRDVCTLLLSTFVTGDVGEQPLWLAGSIGDEAQSLLLLLLLHLELCLFLFKNWAKLRFHGEFFEPDFFLGSTANADAFFGTLFTEFCNSETYAFCQAWSLRTNVRERFY